MIMYFILSINNFFFQEANLIEYFTCKTWILTNLVKIHKLCQLFLEVFSRK